MKVIVVYGGASPEHEVSIRSAKTVYEALSKNHKVYAAYISKQDEWFLVNRPGEESEGVLLDYDREGRQWKTIHDKLHIDIVFPITHGVGGEDGVLQAKLEDWGLHYVGTKSRASKLCFDKVATKAILREHGVNVVDEIIIDRNKDTPAYSACVNQLGDTLFVKPSRSGSSVGVHKVSDEDAFKHGLGDAFKYDDIVLVESAVEEPRELEVAVLEVEPMSFKTSVAGEIVADGEFYTYDAKYASSSQSKTIVNPDMSDELKNELRSVSLQVNDILGCRGMVRVDFLQDGSTGLLYVNEVNTLPGFTSISMYPQLWEGSGMSIEDLVGIMVSVALNSSN